MEVEITKTFECDVLVVGGGVAGIAAAIACETGVSAKNVPYANLKKALLDQGAYLG